ncbi:MAG: sodium:solute symporter [Saprospiraceae bacterium]
MPTTTLLQWLLVIGSSLALLWWVPRARTSEAFYEGRQQDQQPGFWLLLASLVISWLFAKSLTNAANLGLAFGLVGGVAYAAYYLSFGVAGKVLVDLRVKGGFKSIHDFLAKKHGRSALMLFSVLIAFRLFNEIWSNTMVIGSYFGDYGSTPYLMAVVVFTALTLAYALKGGMSSSILTDVVQMVLFGVLLVVLLGMIGGDGVTSVQAASAANAAPLGSWTLAGGVDLLLVAILQSLSYPFHDPVMTDRGFISDPKTTKKAFYWAIPLGGLCIILFSLVGVFAKAAGMEGQAAVEVSRSLGTIALLVVNLIMVTSAASTLDSTFSSWSKLLVKDLSIGNSDDQKTSSIKFGRIAMIALAILGTIPVFFAPEVLSATTISGLMVVGLAPVFLFWNMKVPKWAFVLSVGAGLFVGLHYAIIGIPEYLCIGDGKYAGLLGATLIGTALSFILFLSSRLFQRA